MELPPLALVVLASGVTLHFLGAIFAPYDPFDVKSLSLVDTFTPPA